MVSYPGSTIVPGSVSHALTSTLDIVPTVAALAGVALPTNRSFDGTCALRWLWRCAWGRGSVLGVVMVVG